MVPVKSFKPGTVFWHGVTCTESGEVIVNGRSEVKFYNTEGSLTKSISCNDVCYCTEGVCVLELMSQGIHYIARSCRYCNKLKIFKVNTDGESEGRELSLHTEKSNIEPVAMCHGGPGELCVIDQGLKAVIIFEISSRQVTEKKSIDINMEAEYLCYYNIPSLGEVVATTTGSRPYFSYTSEKQPNLCATSVSSKGTSVSGERIWGLQVNWNPWGIASDQEGHLYVGDYTNQQIVVLSGRSGIILQYLRPSVIRGSIHVEEIMWNSKEGVLVVRHGIDGSWFISFLKNDVLSKDGQSHYVPCTTSHPYQLKKPKLLGTCSTEYISTDSDSNYFNSASDSD